jgi:hypothetical protein
MQVGMSTSLVKSNVNWIKQQKRQVNVHGRQPMNKQYNTKKYPTGGKA